MKLKEILSRTYFNFWLSGFITGLGIGLIIAGLIRHLK